jgi:hypothetical protein
LVNTNARVVQWSTAKLVCLTLPFAMNAKRDSFYLMGLHKDAKLVLQIVQPVPQEKHVPNANPRLSDIGVFKF